ncbi:MAG: CYTH domain-containing protein [Prochlorococcus sp.]|nr:CYTH domain-containing protein [Prochlorococcus sp.]CAI8163353.1 MAG: Inorganic triphosphatase [Prochlorococcus marinus str. MIT 9215]
MGLEIERRFLVVAEEWRELAGPAQPLRQGYLAASPQGFTIRMRIGGQDQAWLTLKAPAQGIARHEFEYLIPLVDAESLWDLAPHRLTKTRYNLNLAGGDWIVDCFDGANAPLVLAEVELPNATHPIQIPAWCGQEITAESKWSNAALARNPIAEWSVQDRLVHGLN